MTTEIAEIPTMEKTRNLSPLANGIAEDLLKLKAIQFNVSSPFTWVSGIKSPVYCDNRTINSDVEIRNHVLNAFVELIKNKFPNAEIIAGVATGGIPLGALIADRLELPFIYVRQKPKEHGLKRQVEGHYTDNQKTIVIEDHISTGSSSINAVKALKEANLNILGLISIMTYGFSGAKELFKQENVTQYSLCDLDTILDVATSKGDLSNQDKDTVLNFRNSQK